MALGIIRRLPLPGIPAPLLRRFAAGAQWNKDKTVTLACPFSYRQHGATMHGQHSLLDLVVKIRLTIQGPSP